MSAERVGPAGGQGVRLAILGFFFLSGACGLIYEVVWMRMLTLVFGATTFATTTVLSTFFCGLGLGSYAFGRISERRWSPLVLYASLEAGIGLFAFLMPLLLSGLSRVYVLMAHWLQIPFYHFSLIRFILSFLVLLVPATLMGGTLETLGRHVGQLYAVNTFGAVVGTTAAGFFLILLLGVRETAYVAGAVNLVVAGVVYSLSRKVDLRPVPGGEHPRTGGEGNMDPREAYSLGIVRLALWAAAISGFCALALEVIWARALVFFLDNSTHAFSTMLTAFLLGIAIGSLLLARLIDGRKRLLVWLGAIQILVGVSSVLALPILGHATWHLYRRVVAPAPASA